MKKISKIIVGLSCLAMLGGCAKTVTASEAAEVADSLKFSDVKATSGKTVYKIEKLDITGETAKSYADAVGLKEGKTETTDISKTSLSLYFVSSSEIKALGDTATTYTVDGTKISYETKAEASVTFLTVSITRKTTTKKNYRADGMLSTKVDDITYTIKDDSIVAKISYTYTWNE